MSIFFRMWIRSWNANGSLIFWVFVFCFEQRGTLSLLKDPDFLVVRLLFQRCATLSLLKDRALGGPDGLLFLQGLC